jgi:hypothetical protein
MAAEGGWPMARPSDEELLAREYLELMKAVGEFDSRALTIKAWSVTFSAAGLTAAYIYHQPIILLIAAASALVFWVVEALWKISQRAHYPRMIEIEANFADPAANPTRPFQVRASRVAAFTGWRRQLRGLEALFFAQVALPHVAVFALALLLYRWAPNG